MSEINIPSDWVACSISDIAQVNPKKIDAEPDTISGFVPMALAPASFSDSLRYEEKHWKEIKKSYTNFQNGDVIFAKVTPCFENGKAAIVDGLPNGIGAGSSEFYVLRPHTPYVLPEILFALIKTQKFANDGAANMTGAVGLRRVPRAFVESFDVPMIPMAEQKVIAEKLDTLLAQVEVTKARLESTLETLKQFRQSVLAAAVSGKLTEDWRHEHSEVDAKAEIQSLLMKREEYFAHLGKEDKPLKRQANNVLLQDLPDSWSYSHIDPFLSLSRAGMKTGPFGSLLKKHEHVNSGIPVLGIENIGHGKYIPGSKIHVNPEKAEDLKGYDVVAGDIVISRSGTVGDVCVLPNDIGEARFSTNIMRLSVMNEYMKPHYLGWLFLGSQIVLDQVAELCKGSTRLFLNQKILSSIKFPIAPLQEQEEIVLRIEKLFSGADATEQQVNQALERVNNLTQSILAKAFRGELTEQWRKENPELISGENSAEALLKKIKAEQAAAKPKRKARTTSA